MAFRIADQDAPDGMFIGADQPTHSIRTGRDDEGTALVVLGPRFNTGQEIDVARRFRELADWATNNFRVGGAAWRWANKDMETADCLPYVGPLKPDNPNFYVATGFNGWALPTERRPACSSPTRSSSAKTPGRYFTIPPASLRKVSSNAASAQHRSAASI